MPMQFTTTDSHLSAYADVLAQITHCIRQRQFYRLVFFSHALRAHLTVYKMER